MALNGETYKNLIFLGKQSAPEYLQGLSYVRAEDEVQLKQYLNANPASSLLIEVDILTQQRLNAFLSLRSFHPQMSFIFVAQAIENTVYVSSVKVPGITLIHSWENPRKQLKNYFKRESSFRNRRMVRAGIRTPVMLKKSALDNRSKLKNIQSLRSGEMKDFSRGGALVQVPAGKLKVKDFVSLMYQTEKGAWVSLECQIRWVGQQGLDSQIIGLQFLAVSA